MIQKELRLIDITESRALAARARVQVARLQAEIDGSRDRLLKSQRKLENSRAVLVNRTTTELVGTIGQRIATLAASLEELHFRLGVELSATAEELQTLAGMADELRNLSEFCALLDIPDVEPDHADP